MIKLALNILFLFTIQLVNGMSWVPAYPYQQDIKGQTIIIKATPYAPYLYNSIGLTEVYQKKKLLYSFNHYYRVPIIPSDDGRYLFTIYNGESSNQIEMIGKSLLPLNQQTVIEVLKYGKPYKRFTLADVIDTILLARNYNFYSWRYNYNHHQYDNAEIECESCIEVYGKRTLKKCDSNKIFQDECDLCNQNCDSLKLLDSKVKTYNNSVYVKNNHLYIITNQNTVVDIDMESLIIKKHTFKNLGNFNPPTPKRKYKLIKLPNKFDEPKINSSENFDISIANFFNLSVQNKNEKYTIFINVLIDRKGKCVKYNGNVYNQENASFSTQSINQEMSNTLEKWIIQQTFKTNLIPRGFDKFYFTCIVNLY